MSPRIQKAFKRLMADERLVYLDCGARAGSAPRWLRDASKHGVYVGIELDEAECARLTARRRRGHTYVAAALDAVARTRTLHVTRSPACTSFLEPNLPVVSRFSGMAEAFEVVRTVEVATTTVDAVVRNAGLERVDVLELDTQGSELDILQGAADTLPSVLAVQVEVEFAPMYVGQPLFADIDAFLGDRGFALHALARYHARYAAGAPAVPTNGRLLWGHAQYLRDDARAIEQPDMAVRLALIAAALGFPDAAADVLSRLQSRTPADRQKDVVAALTALRTPAPASWPARVGQRLAAAGVALGRASDATRRADIWRT